MLELSPKRCSARRVPDLVQLDLRHLWHPFTPTAIWEDSAPIVIERGDGNYLIDTNGTEYFDGVSSLWTNVHGHNEPRLNEAIRSQLDRIAHSTLLGLGSAPSIELAESLVKLAPNNLTRVFYSDSGSTAVEIALKQSFQFWALSERPAKRSFAHLENAYHGDTVGAVSVGGIDIFHATFGPLLFDTHALPSPHPFRHPLGSPEAVLEHCLAEARKTISQNADQLAAVIVEPLVQGAAGMLVHPAGYLRGLADLCKEHNVHLIVDEVATGFGRTGTMFACEHENIEPDFLCLAKGITGGYLPLAATLSTETIYDAFRGDRSNPRTFFHGHTYTGNALGCAVAIASLGIFREDNVIDGLTTKIQTLTEELQRLAAHPNVADVRQRGLMVGVELGKSNGDPLDPSLRAGAAVCNTIREKKIILRPLGDVVVLMPPLSSTEAELRELVRGLAWALENCPTFT